tara:strand:+ start:3377 stop:5227 length:1851 start_codon:yes stop_codon:yes gene_type:complete
MPQISKATTQNLKASMFLKRDLEQSARIERTLERKSLRIKKKLVEDRDRTLKNLLKSNREKDKQGGASGLLGLLFGGGIGGALLRNRGKPGGGGGGLFSRFRKPRVPNTPGELLRMQKGPKNVSRLSRFSRFRNLGRISKSNVILNTAFAGLEFAGRKESGQTNLQAGVGTAGSVTGGILGAAIGQTLIPIPVVGALIGGFIGSSIGGGVADFLTGANRRRKFEEQRVIVSPQKSLFSGAMDDFDRVLNKFELAVPFLKIDDGDDDEVEPVRRRTFVEIIKDFFDRPKPPPPVKVEEPKPETPFFQQPAFVIPVTAVITAAALLLMAEPGDVISFGALAKLLKIKPTQLQKVKNVEKLMEELAKKDMPGLSKKGIRVRIENAAERANRKELERILKESLKRDKNIIKNRKIEQETAKRIKDIEGSKEFSNLVKEMKKRNLNIKDFLRQGKFLDEATDDLDMIQRAIEAANKAGVDPSIILRKGKAAYDTLLQNRLTRLRELERIFEKNRIQINAERVEDMQKAFKMIKQAKDDFIRLFQQVKGKPLSSNDLDGFSSSDIAMVDNEGDSNIIFSSSNEQQPIVNVINGEQGLAMGGTRVSSFDAMTKYAENMALMTT